MIRNHLNRVNIIEGAWKLPSGAFALTFKSTEAKNTWQSKGQLKETFGEMARVKEHTLDVIVFRIPKGAISNQTLESRLPKILDQNPLL